MLKVYKTIHIISWPENNIHSKDIEINFLPMFRYLDQGYKKLIQIRWLVWGINFWIK